MDADRRLLSAGWPAWRHPFGFMRHTGGQCLWVDLGLVSDVSPHITGSFIVQVHAHHTFGPDMVHLHCDSAGMKAEHEKAVIVAEQSP